MLGQDGELAHDHRQLAIALHVEGEGDLVRRRSPRPSTRSCSRAPMRGLAALFDLEAEDHVLGRDRRAVMPARFVAELEGDRGEVGRVGRPFGDQPVGGRRLLQAVRHQAFVDQAEAGGRLALVEDRVEAIEGADIGHAHQAALRRVRVDKSKCLKSAGYFGVADQRHGVMAMLRLRLVLRARW